MQKFNLNRKGYIALAFAGLVTSSFAAASTYSYRLAATGIKSAIPAPSWSVTGSPATTFASATTGTFATPDLTLSVRNAGGAGSLGVIAFTGANSSDFSATNNCTNVAENASCIITSRFKPTGTGVRTAALQIGGAVLNFSGTGLPGTASLIGTGASTAGACASGAVGCATWNPSDKSARIVLSGGNLIATSTGGWDSVRATVGKSSGKVYWEYTYGPSSMNHILGIADANYPLNGNIGSGVSSFGFNQGNNSMMSWSGATQYAFTPPNMTQGVVVSFALDMDAKKLHIGVNGVWKVNPAMGDVVVGLSGTVYPALSLSGDTNGANVNFGQQNFAYPVPLGYQAGVW